MNHDDSGICPICGVRIGAGKYPTQGELQRWANAPLCPSCGRLLDWPSDSPSVPRSPPTRRPVPLPPTAPTIQYPVLTPIKSKAMTPKSAAEFLTSHFLEAGSFVAAGGSMGAQPIAANSSWSADADVTGFSGLAVESVGYTMWDDYL
ncbi:MAG: hypothetical protein JWP89_2704 [Schlesneria sp.]|nr:hypothetical protein [Schlesneria sp.]